VSTVNTIGYGTIEHPTDESEQAVFPFLESLYAESKRMGEQAVLEGKDAHPDLEGIIVNPGFMIGSYDTKPSSGRLLLAGYRKPVMFAPRGGKAFVNVVDVAEVVVNALTMGTPGRTYIVTNSKASLTFRELYKLQAHVCGYRQRVIQIPNWVLLAVGHVGEWLRRMGLRTQVSLNNIQQLLVREYYDNSAARRDLGLKETPIEDAICDFYEWRKNRH
jgi:dihydroflavonol-4-reductase